MFTARICCCCAIIASQIMAVVGIILSVAVAVSSWVSNPPLPLYIDIIQTVLVSMEVIACLLVFFASCSVQPSLMLPIIVIQVLNSFSLFGTGIWVVVELWNLIMVGEIILYFIIYLIALLLSLFVLHCHICCYKVLLVKKR
ncbi:hypothetical protein PMAYCL1PPCAC_33038, partial [Pristionchus mayeri]